MIGRNAAVIMAFLTVELIGKRHGAFPEGALVASRLIHQKVTVP